MDAKEIEKRLKERYRRPKPLSRKEYDRIANGYMCDAARRMQREIPRIISRYRP